MKHEQRQIIAPQSTSNLSEHNQAAKTDIASERTEDGSDVDAVLLDFGDNVLLDPSDSGLANPDCVHRARQTVFLWSHCWAKASSRVISRTLLAL